MSAHEPTGAAGRTVEASVGRRISLTTMRRRSSAIVSADMARRFFPMVTDRPTHSVGADPKEQSVEIVGIVSDVRSGYSSTPCTGRVSSPSARTGVPAIPMIVVRSDAAPSAALEGVRSRESWQEYAPNLTTLLSIELVATAGTHPGDGLVGLRESGPRARPDGALCPSAHTVPQNSRDRRAVALGASTTRVMTLVILQD